MKISLRIHEFVGSLVTQKSAYTTVQPSASLRGPGFAQDEHEFLNKSSGVAILELTNLHGFQLNCQKWILMMNIG